MKHVTSLLYRFNESSKQRGRARRSTNIVNSRYSIVMATSKRARQIIGGDEPLVNMKTGMKPLSVAVEELNEGKIKILGDEETEE